MLQVKSRRDFSRLPNSGLVSGRAGSGMTSQHGWAPAVSAGRSLSPICPMGASHFRVMVGSVKRGIPQFVVFDDFGPERLLTLDTVTLGTCSMTGNCRLG